MDLGSKISVAVAKKALDTARSQGDAVVQLIQSAAETGRGSSRGARPSGGSGPKAGGLDLFA
ncbi:MAG: YjfB family protein [Phycisphaerales bacterium]|nr:MAG: YjfB family protein [Phycisphaerales bacterium]